MNKTFLKFMRNRRMAEKLENGEAISLHNNPLEGDHYVLSSKEDPTNFNEMDYCNAKTEQWIWSIGKRISDGKILASHKTDLNLNPEFECIWLR